MPDDPAPTPPGFSEERRTVERTRVTAAVINHNGMEVLPSTLEALSHSTFPDLRVVVVDDHSTDGSLEWLRHTYPAVPLLQVPGEPVGKASIPRNLALREEDSEFVLLLDNDVSLGPDAISRLAEVLLTHPDVFACSPRLLNAQRPDLIYYDGTQLHFLGVTCDTARDLEVETQMGPENREALACAVMMVRREVALDLGGFDESYCFGWGEDAELPMKAILRGWRSLVVPAALGAHVERERGIRRAEAQLVNRYRVVLTFYSRRALWLLAPALVIFEGMLLAASIIRGFLPQYLKALFVTVRTLPGTFRTRKELQRSRTTPDSALMRAGDLSPTGALSRSPVIRRASQAATGFYSLYWRLVSRWL